MRMSEEKMCQDCNNTGFILYKDEAGHEYGKRCKCVEIERARNLLRKSGLAMEFQKKTFDDFVTHNDERLNDAKNTVMQYAKQFQNIRGEQGNSLIICGQVGAGKTHLGTACCRQMMDDGVAVIYMGYRDAVTTLKSKVTDAPGYKAEVEKYKKAEVLFIDDFLKGRITEADVNVMYEIVNFRYNNRMPLVISTEKDLNQMLAFDEAITSRLIEMSKGHIVMLKGSELNYRIYRGGAA